VTLIPYSLFQAESNTACVTGQPIYIWAWLSQLQTTNDIR